MEDSKKNSERKHNKKQDLKYNKRFEKIKKHREQKTKYKFNYMLFKFSLLIIFILILLFYSFQYLFNDNALAKVNNHRIYPRDIEKRYNALPETYKSLYNKAIILNQTINEYLILDNAKKLGITASQKEVEAKLNELLRSLNLTLDQYLKNISKKNITYHNIIELLKTMIIFDKYVNKVIKPRINVNETEIYDFYNTNYLARKINVSLDSVRPQIMQHLYSIKLKKEFDNEIKKLKRESNIVIFRT